MVSIEQGRVVEALSGYHSSLLVFERYFGQLSLSRLRFSLSFDLYFFFSSFFFILFLSYSFLLVKLFGLKWIGLVTQKPTFPSLPYSYFWCFGMIFLFFFLSSLLSPFWTSWFKLKPPLPTISLSKAKFLSQDFYLISYHAFLFIGMEEGSRTFLGGTSMFLDFHGSILAIQHFCTTCWVGYFSTCFLPP